MKDNVTPDKTSAREVDLSRFRSIIAKYSDTTLSELVPVLQSLQDSYGYLPMEVLEELSASTGIPLSKIYGVVTFYAQFHLEPRGKHIVKLCSGTACHIKGAPDIEKRIADILQVEEGQTTQDYKFTYKAVACIGACFLAPVMMIDDRYYGKLTEEKTENILKNY
ncbi:MAG: NADH-quinone oxidoreductase subunit NuoE [Candidatus Brocadiaceae bacterium]|nr:NADH-quinone oxidoreductase subunit NuoE [Candidatus Brocadiaceae bacterium]